MNFSASFKTLVVFTLVVAIAVVSLVTNDRLRQEFADTDLWDERSVSSEEKTERGDENRHVGPAKIDRDDRSEPANGSIRQKTEQREINAGNNTGLSQSELNDIHWKTYNSYYDQKGQAEFLAEQYEILRNEVGEEEANFRFALLNSADDWEEAKRLVGEREDTLGQKGGYDSILLNMGLNSGSISAEEVQLLVSRGAPLPDNIVFRLAANGNIDAISDLANSGLVGDPNFEHPTLSMNALGAFIHYVSAYPAGISEVAASKSLVRLIDLGVSVHPTSGSFDPLDFALQGANNENAKLKYAFVRTLLQSGVSVGRSHVETIEQLPDSQIRTELESLLANYL